jgi:L-rhamnose mutarotase
VERAAFTLQVRPERLEEYKTHHRQVWPEMLDALRLAGWANYSLFLRPDGLLVGYVETPHGLDAARAAMAANEVNARWQTLMAPFFVSDDGAHADTRFVELEAVFHLD